MTCRQAQTRLVDSIYAADPGAPEVRAHLEACEQCARAYAETRAALAAIEPPLRIQASPDFKERVMNEIAKVPAPAPRRRLIPKMLWAAAAVAALVLLAPLLGSLGSRRGQTGQPVLTLLAESAQAMSNLQSVHITARMRTRPQENFEFIDPSLDWVPLEMWKQFGQMPRWRVEKPRRVVVMDGTSSVCWIKPDQAARGGPRPGFVNALGVLLDADKLMETELEVARKNSFAATVTEETRNGARSFVLRVNRTPQGVVTNGWALNSSIGNSNHSRIYRFDAATKRLSEMQVILHTATGDVSVFEITSVRYNEVVDPALFTLALPANVNWYVPPEQMPTASRPLPQSAQEAAKVLFDAFAREDWERALTVYPASAIPEDFKRHFGGMQVISLGTPFQSGLYPGWFVPYEIKLKSGEVKKFKLAVRNTNPAKRWVFDGGL